MLMTVVQQAFIDWCIAYSKFQIVDDMSIVVVAHDVNSYDTLGKGVELGRYGYLEPRMVEIGRHHFPDAPGQPFAFCSARGQKPKFAITGRNSPSTLATIGAA
ncbi:hypothetical protein QZM96_09190 [Burkholderia multivorans]|nr:hypothetical protein [Burkholderia multivorans]MDN8003257.1 hypothetical protein [Burkholderia multivorans]